MKYDVLTFDTQTVETNGFNFDGGLLAQLKQFSTRGADVVLSLIVAAEILRHLREKTQSAKDAVEHAHKKAAQFGLKSVAEKAFPDAPDPRSLSRARLFQYIKDIGAEVIPPDDLPMQDLVRAYVRAEPPFAGSGKKKNEFPDAIALLSLQRWAKANGKRILAVSGDKDWADFGTKSDVIDVVTGLGEALSKLQEDEERAGLIALNLLSAIRAKSSMLLTSFEERLIDRIGSINLHAEGDSSYSIEGDEVEISFKDYSFAEIDDEKMNLRIFQSGPKIIVASIDLQILIDAVATFSLAIYDSIDKDYVALGTTQVRKDDEEFYVTVLITFEGEFEGEIGGELDGGNVKIANFELIDAPGSIDFGWVEPDYGEPDYDEDFGRDFEDEF